MKVKVPLRDTTMKASSHWLQIDSGTEGYHVSLENAKGPLAGAYAPITGELLENLADVGAGVIIKIDPLRFYKTDKDVRISFTEDAERPDLTGFDRVDVKEFTEAIREILGGEGHEEKKHKRTATKRKTSTGKTSTRKASIRKKSAHSRKG